jgi:hypothetical protein
MRTLFTLLFISFAGTAMAQQPVMTTVGSIPNNATQVAPGVFMTKDTTVNMDTMKRPQLLVEEKPRFNGNLNQYLASHVKVPKGTKLEGRITTNFVVDTAGKVGMVTIAGKGPKDKLTPLEKEIVRVVSNMPPWIPGKLHGRHVPVKYSLPIDLN